MAGASSEQARFYTWRAPGKGVVVHLSLGVVERISQEAFQGLRALPRRGAEIGGILLGTAHQGDQVAVTIVDSVPVLCGHYFGPSYVLTQDEKQALQQVLARWKPLPARSVYAVGYYRSHTRDELFLSDDDVWLMSTYFADPTRVALLVKPRITAPSLGGFFFWEGDRIRAESCYAEFPFDAEVLGPAAAEPRAREAPAPAVEPQPEAAEAPTAVPEPSPAPPQAPVTAVEAEPQAAAIERAATEPVTSVASPPEAAPSPAAPEPPVPPPEPEPVPLPSFLRTVPARGETAPRRLPRIPWLWIPICLVLVLLGGLLGTQGALYLNLGGLLSRDADPYALRLAVTEYGDNLHLTWDRDAAALSQAQRAILIIGDGDQTRTLELDPMQLRRGSVSYRRASGPVRFRLELYLRGNRSLSETWEPNPGQSP